MELCIIEASWNTMAYWLSLTDVIDSQLWLIMFRTVCKSFGGSIFSSTTLSFDLSPFSFPSVPHLPSTSTPFPFFLSFSSVRQQISSILRVVNWDRRRSALHKVVFQAIYCSSDIKEEEKTVQYWPYIGFDCKNAINISFWRHPFYWQHRFAALLVVIRPVHIPGHSEICYLHHPPWTPGGEQAIPGCYISVEKWGIVAWNENYLIQYRILEMT